MDIGFRNEKNLASRFVSIFLFKLDPRWRIGIDARSRSNSLIVTREAFNFGPEIPHGRSLDHIQKAQQLEQLMGHGTRIVGR